MQINVLVVLMVSGLSPITGVTLVQITTANFALPIQIHARDAEMDMESMELAALNALTRSALIVPSTETSAQPVRRAMESAAVSAFPVPTTDA